MSALIPIREQDGRQAVSGRDLHSFLGLGRDYTNWFKSMTEYGFIEGQDFTPIRAESTGGRPSVDHALTLDMAKELAMIQRTPKGKEARQYFIEVEKRAQGSASLSDEEIVHQALAITSRKVKELEAKVATDAPKVEYVERFVASEDLRIMRNVAKSIGVPENTLRSTLVAHHWIYAEVMERWSGSKRAKETITRYSPASDKREYFRPVPVHLSLIHI